MMFIMTPRAQIAAVLLFGASIVIACGSENEGDPNGGASGSSSNGSSSFGGTSSGATDDSGTGDGNPANCLAPVDMYIMFDRSGSMGTDCSLGDTTASKWCRSINALSGYFKSAGAANQAAALQFFPMASFSKTDFCSTGDNYNAAAIPSTGYQELPSSAFDALLNSTAPGGTGGGTPTEAAIRGVTRFTAANRRPGRVTIGILITDGDPNGCNEGTKFLSDILSAHNAATTIRTYVIGMQGADDAKLEEIAQGGAAPPHPATVGSVTNACGTSSAPCRHWNVGDGDPAVFGAALAAIQESADGCKPGGGTVNPPH